MHVSTERRSLRERARSGFRHATALWRAVGLELGPLLVVMVGAIGLWAFVELADEVTEGDTHAVDEAILMSMRTPGDPTDPFGPRWVEEMARDATAFGGIGALVAMTLFAFGFTWLSGRRAIGLFLVGAVGSGLLASLLLKQGFARPRPELVPHLSHVYTSSFPSGHSMMSAVAYLTTGGLLARVQPTRRLKIYFLTVAILLTVVVGVSRVYLGVHWPSDVLAGWAVGAFWAVACWFAARRLGVFRREAAEPEAV